MSDPCSSCLHGKEHTWDDPEQQRDLSDDDLSDDDMLLTGIIQEPMRLTWNAALEETEMVLFESVHKLFKATGVNAQDVSCLAG